MFEDLGCCNESPYSQLTCSSSTYRTNIACEHAHILLDTTTYMTLDVAADVQSYLARRFLLVRRKSQRVEDDYESQIEDPKPRLWVLYITAMGSESQCITL